MNNNVLIQIPDIHIGNEINAYLKDKGISKAKLARDLCMDSANLGRRIKKKSIETHFLVKLCNAIGHNFFTLWCGRISPENLSFTTTIEPESIGCLINIRLKDMKIKQIEFASQLGIAQPEITKIIRKTSFNTDKLAIISRILGKNFFYEYCINNDMRQEIKDKSEGSNLLINRYENLVIENSRLKQELTDARMEIARLRYTV